MEQKIDEAIDSQCFGCDYKTPTFNLQNGYCYVFRERPEGCTTNTSKKKLASSRR